MAVKFGDTGPSLVGSNNRIVRLRLDVGLNIFKKIELAFFGDASSWIFSEYFEKKFNLYLTEPKYLNFSFSKS